jgi:hypothetical protein
MKLDKRAMVISLQSMQKSGEHRTGRGFIFENSGFTPADSKTRKSGISRRIFSKKSPHENGAKTEEMTGRKGIQAVAVVQAGSRWTRNRSRAV